MKAVAHHRSGKATWWIVGFLTLILCYLSIGTFRIGPPLSPERNRTVATLHAIVSALERYHEKNGRYPEPVSGSKEHSIENIEGAQMLYQVITGDGTDKIKGAPPTPSSGVVADPEKMINGDFIPTRESNGKWHSKLNATKVEPKGVIYLVDGFGHPFQYDVAPSPGTTASDKSQTLINPTYDVWSHANDGDNHGTKAADKNDNTANAAWIKNW